MKPVHLIVAILTTVAINATLTTKAQSSDTTKPSVQEDYDKIFTKTEIPPCFPFGDPAWKAYLRHHLNYRDLDDNSMPCTVVVQFIVDLKGKVSDVQAISGPATGGFREEAVRVVKKSGLWTPAIQNGRQVKAYGKASVTFEPNPE